MRVLLQLTEALAADTISTLVSGLRSAVLRTNTASSSSSSRGYSRDRSRAHQSRDLNTGAISDDVSGDGVQCKAMQTALPHGRTLADSLKQVTNQLCVLLRVRGGGKFTTLT